jgi:transcriptional regulator with XRE-family HTH domain
MAPVSLSSEHNGDFSRTEGMIAEIAEKIQNARRNQGLSQKDLARKAHLNQQQISAIENGANPTLKTVIKVCETLNLKLTLE